MTTSQLAGQRVTFILIPKVQRDLLRLQERTQMSGTDLANRAISLYEFFDAQQREGRDVVTVDNLTGQSAKLVIEQAEAPGEPARTAVPAVPAAPATPAAWRSWRAIGRHRRRLFPSPARPGWPTPKLA